MNVATDIDLMNEFQPPYYMRGDYFDVPTLMLQTVPAGMKEVGIHRIYMEAKKIQSIKPSDIPGYCTLNFDGKDYVIHAPVPDELKRFLTRKGN